MYFIKNSFDSIYSTFVMFTSHILQEPIARYFLFFWMYKLLINSFSEYNWHLNWWTIKPGKVIVLYISPVLLFSLLVALTAPSNRYIMSSLWPKPGIELICSFNLFKFGTRYIYWCQYALKKKIQRKQKKSGQWVIIHVRTCISAIKN